MDNTQKIVDKCVKTLRCGVIRGYTGRIFTFQHRTGSNAVLLREATCEIFRVVETYLEGNLRDVHTTGLPILHNQLIGGAEAISADELIGTLPHQALEFLV